MIVVLLLCACVLALDQQSLLRLKAAQARPLAPGWLTEHRGMLEAEMSSHRFLFVVGSPLSGLARDASRIQCLL